MNPSESKLDHPEQDVVYHNSHELVCPMCLGVIKEAFMTSCGHSFCYACISTHIDRTPTCPTCSTSITRAQLFPNFALNKVINQSQPLPSTHRLARSLHTSITNQQNLTIPEINGLMDALLDRRKQLQDKEQDADLELLSYFLEHSKTSRLKTLESINSELEILSQDIKEVDKRKQVTAKQEVPDDQQLSSASQSLSPTDRVSRKKQKLLSHINDLEASYFTTHSQHTANSQQDPATPIPDSTDTPADALSVFSQSLSNLTKYSRCKVLSSFRNDSVAGMSNIISSIAFDRNQQLFATGGVTKKIKLFDLQTVVEKSGVVNVPVHEISTQAKLSCLCWNTYIRSQLCSSDYHGVVCLWDAMVGSPLRLFDEHEKRVWSVDCCSHDPTRITSASDDGTVKIWSTNQSKSAITISNKTNVCSVRFNQFTPFHLAFGTADHHIKYIDIRKPTEAVAVLSGHLRAVSYVTFTTPTELVSASTDSSLKVWSVNGECLRTLKGHKNEKNFAGLSSQDDLIACGSETNQICIYNRMLSHPVVVHDLNTNEQVSDDEVSPFVSAVCWCRNSNILVAGNSQGMVNVLEVV
eukprot:c7994_g1_i2.p1 GENE.c7994_g1_i2~~c7994_g1_i2.p1  ORF type:complete len:581 (+),score=140.67 c7994_g1_i2:57-1799(+)